MNYFCLNDKKKSLLFSKILHNALKNLVKYNKLVMKNYDIFITHLLMIFNNHLLIIISIINFF